MTKLPTELSSGSQWEQEVFGVNAGGEMLERPQHISFYNSMQEVQFTRLERRGSNGQMERYDYENPTWGMTAQLFSEVRRHLPEMINGVPRGPLFLHIACRTPRMSLDVYHGVDAFFFWESVYVTLDAKINYHSDATADFIITPNEMKSERIGYLGQAIAHLLNKRRKNEVIKSPTV